MEEESILIKRKKRGISEKDVYAGVNLYTESETIGDFEYEIDKEKFFGKGNINVPELVQESKPYSKNIGLVTDPIIAMKKTIKIIPGQTIILDLIIGVSEEKENIQTIIKKYKNTNIITKTFELSKAKVEAESIYLELKGTDIEKYQKMLSYLIFQNPLKKLYIKEVPKKVYSQNELWKYGISGDLPILLIKIKDLNDMHIIYDVLKAYEFYRSKNIKIDLVILNEERNSYEQYMKFEIENAILNKQLYYLKNQFGRNI